MEEMTEKEMQSVKMSTLYELRLIFTQGEKKDYTTDEIDANDILLIGYESTYGEKLEEFYQNSMLEGRFKIYYN